MPVSEAQYRAAKARQEKAERKFHSDKRGIENDREKRGKARAVHGLSDADVNDIRDYEAEKSRENPPVPKGSR